MPLLKWKPEYSVNKNELDNHHIRLFDILNIAYENVMHSAEVNSILSLVDELIEYTRYHFVAEEQQMEKSGFDGIDVHIAEHRQFAKKMERLKVDCHENNLEASKELIVVLGNWILHHILTEDRRFSNSISYGSEYHEESSHG